MLPRGYTVRAPRKSLSRPHRRPSQARCSDTQDRQMAVAADTCRSLVERGAVLINVKLSLLSSGSQQKPVLSEECLVLAELLILSHHLLLCPLKSSHLTPCSRETNPSSAFQSDLSSPRCLIWSWNGSGKYTGSQHARGKGLQRLDVHVGPGALTKRSRTLL